MNDEIDPLSRYVRNIKPDLTWWQAVLALLAFVACMILVNKVVMPYLSLFQKTGEQTQILSEP